MSLFELSYPRVRVLSVCFAKHSLKFLPFKGRWIQKRMFLKTEGFFFRCCFCCSSLGLESPPRFFPLEKLSRPPLRGTTLSVCFAKHSLKVPALQGEVDSKTYVFEDGGVLFSLLFLLPSVRLGTPSEIFSVLEKLSRPPLRGTIFSVCFAKQCLKFLFTTLFLFV